MEFHTFTYVVVRRDFERRNLLSVQALECGVSSRDYGDMRCKQHPANGRYNVPMHTNPRGIDRTMKKQVWRGYYD